MIDETVKCPPECGECEHVRIMYDIRGKIGLGCHAQEGCDTFRRLLHEQLGYPKPEEWK